METFFVYPNLLTSNIKFCIYFSKGYMLFKYFPVM